MTIKANDPLQLSSDVIDVMTALALVDTNEGNVAYRTQVLQSTFPTLFEGREIGTALGIICDIYYGTKYPKMWEWKDNDVRRAIFVLRRIVESQGTWDAFLKNLKMNIIGKPLFNDYVSDLKLIPAFAKQFEQGPSDETVLFAIWDHVHPIKPPLFSPSQLILAICIGAIVLMLLLELV